MIVVENPDKAWLVVVVALALCACKKAEPGAGAVEPVRVDAAHGAIAIELSPDGSRLAVQRCIHGGDGACTVEVLRLPGELEREPVDGAMVGWIGERLLMVRRSGDHLVVFDDQGTSRDVPAEPGATLRGASCGGDRCALSIGEERVDVVAVRGVAGPVELVARGVGGAERLFTGDKPDVGVAVDRARPVAYVVVDAPRQLVAIDLDSGAEQWRTPLLDDGPYSNTTPLMILSNDGQSLLVVQARHAYEVFEAPGFEVIDAGSGARTGSTRGGPGQITDLAPSGPGGVVVLAVREPHAHSGGYSRWVGTVAFELADLKMDASLNARQWLAPNLHRSGFYPRALAVTSAGVVLVAMER